MPVRSDEVRLRGAPVFVTVGLAWTTGPVMQFQHRHGRCAP
jgi:hypothetical protein